MIEEEAEQKKLSSFIKYIAWEHLGDGFLRSIEDISLEEDEDE